MSKKVTVIQYQILTGFSSNSMSDSNSNGKMSYSESEADSNFAINSVSDSNSNVKTWD